MKNDITLRNFMDFDFATFVTWLNTDHVKAWYTETEDWLVEITKRASDFNWIHHYIVEHNGIAIGFCQYYDCFNAGELEDWYQCTAPHETFSIDYLIGEINFLNKGYGKEIIRPLLKRYLLKKKP